MADGASISPAGTPHGRYQSRLPHVFLCSPVWSLGLKWSTNLKRYLEKLFLTIRRLILEKDFLKGTMYVFFIPA